MNDTAFLLAAIRFAADRHRDQRRKGEDASPYINHPLEVAHLLATTGGVDDVEVLAAAVLHDTIEDTETRPEDLERRFGARVRAIVEEVTDDKSLPKNVRKRKQIEHAPVLSTDAKLVKLGDKISNVLSVVNAPPVDWSDARRREYLDWTVRVVEGCRTASATLADAYDHVLAGARDKIDLDAPGIDSLK